MAGNIKGITIEIAGDTQKLNKALEDVNKKTKDVSSELKQVEKLLKLDPGNTELLAQKQKLLAEAVANSKEKLDRLKTAQQQVNEQFKNGEISEEQYRAFQREVTKAEQELKKFETQLKSTGMTAEQLGQKIQGVGQKMTGIGKDLSMKVTAPIVAAGAAAFKFAADLEDAMGASDQIFGKASGSTKKWADGLESYYGIAEGEALEYANMMGSMLQNIGGLSEKEASKQAQALIELAGDLTAMFGGTTESAVQALTGALKGNNSMLDNYGMGVNDATIKTKALEMGLYDGTGQMDLATKQAATLALIMEQTGAAQGQAAREAEGASGTLRGLQTELKNVAADLGQMLTPIITPLVAKLKEMVKAFGDMSPSTQKVILAIAALAAAIGPLLLVFGPLISAIGTLITGLGAMSAAMTGGATVMAGLSAGFPVLGAAITVLTGPIGIAIAALAALVVAGVAVYKNWDEIKAFGAKLWVDLKTGWSEGMEALKKGWTEGWAAIGTMFKGWGEQIALTWTTLWDDLKSFLVEWWPLLLGAIAGPMGLVAGAIYKNWDEIKVKTIEVWDSIKAFFEEWWKKLTDWMGTWNPWNFVQNKWNEFKTKIIEVLNNLKTETNTWWSTFTTWLGTWNPWSFVKQIWDNFKTNILGVWNNLKTDTDTWWNTFTSWLGTWNPWAAVQGLWNTWKDKTIQIWKDLKTDAVTWGHNIVQGMADGIKNKIQTAVNAMRDVAESVKNKVKNAFGIHSPSAVMAEYGQNISQGLANGIATKSNEVTTAMGNIVTGVQGQINTIISSFTSMKATLETPIIPAPIQQLSPTPSQTAPTYDDTPSSSGGGSSPEPTINVPHGSGADAERAGLEKGANYAYNQKNNQKYLHDYPLQVMGIFSIQDFNNGKQLAATYWTDTGALAASGYNPDSSVKQPSLEEIINHYGEENAEIRDGKVYLKQFAAGGIVTRPTIGMIAEAGDDEAILPLPRLQPMMTEALLGAVEALSGGSNVTTNRQINLSVINKGTIVGRNGMEDFAKTVSKQISKDFGLATGGAW